MKPKIIHSGNSRVNLAPEKLLGPHLFSLRWEIVLVLILKFISLWLIWHFFFSAPKAKHMQLPEPQVTEHLLKPASPVVEPKPASVSINSDNLTPQK